MECSALVPFIRCHPYPLHFIEMIFPLVYIGPLKRRKMKRKNKHLRNGMKARQVTTCLHMEHCTDGKDGADSGLGNSILHQESILSCMKHKGYQLICLISFEQPCTYQAHWKIFP